MRPTIVCLLVVLLCGPVTGETIVRDVSTGYDNASGLVIGGGLADPDYTIIPGGLTATVLPEAFPIPPWLANTDTSKWVGFDNEGSNADPGDYDFSTTFSLGGADPAKTRLLGGWATDNTGLDILINGSSTGATNGGNFGVLQPFGVLGAGLFQPGDNTITFRLNNAEPGFNPSGLRVDARVYDYGLPDTFDFAIYNTGVDDDGIPLAEDAVDPHWTLSGSGVTEGVGPDAYTTTGAGGFPVGPWLSDAADPGSAWIAPSTDTNAPANPEPGGTSIYEYSQAFTTPMDGTVTIAGLQSGDGSVTDVLIDGISGTFTPVGFNMFGDFSVTAAVTGTDHTLTVLVDNGEGNPNPTGVRVSVETAGFVPIPEPSTLVLALAGLLGLALFGWRRRAA